jgi:hypothetical protein
MPRRRISPDEPRVLAGTRDADEAGRIAAWIVAHGIAASARWTETLRRWEIVCPHASMRAARRLYIDHAVAVDDAGRPLAGRERAPWDP